jgi:hypothetical protein
MSDKTTISIICTKAEKGEITKRREIRGFRSDNEYVRHLLTLGTLVERAMDGKRLTPHNFGAALFNIANKVMDKGAETMLQAESAEELSQWMSEEAAAPRVITGARSTPTR